MAVEKEIIVAVEFGSSKIRGVAGCKNIDGSVQVLDIEQVDARHCIRKGVVYNIDKTVMCLKHIVDKMENALDMRVRKVFVGIGGQEEHGVTSVCHKNRGFARVGGFFAQNQQEYGICRL